MESAVCATIRGLVLERLLLLVRTTRHLPPGQIASRARLALLRKARQLRGARFEPPARAEVVAHQPLWSGLEGARQHSDAAKRIAEAEEIARGRFEFLALAFEYDGEPDWAEPRASALWRYHLHYFDYVLALALAGDYRTFRRLAMSWLERSRPLRGDAWHPYPVSLRVVNWCHALSAFSRELAEDAAFRDELARAIAGQAEFVYRNLETDVRGNHLLENLRALIWAGIVFGNERWLARGLRMLEVEVAEQVLEDGCHFERAPGYHLVVLRDVFEIRLFLARNREVPRWLDDAVARMAEFLVRIIGPNDRLPLFKDTVLSEEFRPRDVLMADSFYLTLVDAPPPTSAKPRAMAALQPGGYVIVRDDRHFLVADYGKPCPDYLPAHAHADMFSFELTIDGAPCIVDSGVYAYQGEWRPRFRATAAHNTVEVAGENQSEVWGSFRVARRARPRNVRAFEENGAFVVQGEHDGYERLSPKVTHRRTMLWREGVLLIVDQLFGSGEVNATSRIHFHPDAEVHVHAFGENSPREEHGWYSERFGEKRGARILALDAAGPMPLVFGYCVGDATVSLISNDRVELIRGGTRLTLEVPRDGAPRIR